MEDALLSMESFSILSGAGLIDASDAEPIYVHQTSQVEVKETNKIELPDVACWNGEAIKEDTAHYHQAADIFIMVLDEGEVNGTPRIPAKVEYVGDKTVVTSCPYEEKQLTPGTVVLVDYYVKKIGGAAMIEITADKFGGNYYLEASTLFRRENDGVDMPAEFIIPNCKVQSNFTFSLAATGDPSTFTFTMDAFPDYTKFDKTHKVLAAIQVIYGDETGEDNAKRECGPTFKMAAYEGSGVNISPSGEVKGNVAFVVSGEVPTGGTHYDVNEFGTLSEDAVEMDINFSARPGVTYTIKQENKALGAVYPDEFPDNVKTKDYDGAMFVNEPYQFLLVEGATPVKVTITEKDSGAEVVNATITNNVTFA